MIKLLQESSIEKRYMNIKLIECVVTSPGIVFRTHIKRLTVLTKLVLRGHPSRYQHYYHDILTCNVNKVNMILLISIHAFLISMDLFTQSSSKETIPYFFHNEKRYHKYQMLIFQCIYCHMCYMCVWYSIPNIETISQICFDSSKSMKSIAFR